MYSTMGWWDGCLVQWDGGDECLVQWDGGDGCIVLWDVWG